MISPTDSKAAIRCAVQNDRDVIAGVRNMSEGNDKGGNMALYVGVGVALGAGLGASFGAAFGNVAMGVALGPVFGIALGLVVWSIRSGNGDE